MTAGLVIFALEPGPGLAIVAGLLTGLGHSLPWPSIAATVLNEAPENERAASVGILTACVDLFVGGSSFIDGAVAHRFGYGSLYWLAVGAVACAAVLGYSTVRGTEHKQMVEVPQPADLVEMDLG